MTDFKPNIDGSFLFASMGEGNERTTCFIENKTGAISFEGSRKYENDLFEKAKELLGKRKGQSQWMGQNAK